MKRVSDGKTYYEIDDDGSVSACDAQGEPIREFNPDDAFRLAALREQEVADWLVAEDLKSTPETRLLAENALRLGRLNARLIPITEAIADACINRGMTVVEPAARKNLADIATEAYSVVNELRKQTGGES